MKTIHIIWLIGAISLHQPLFGQTDEDEQTEQTEENVENSEEEVTADETPSDEPAVDPKPADPKPAEPEPEAQAVPTCTIKTKRGGRANLRTGPSTRYRVIVSLPVDTKLEYIETSGNWLKIKYENSEGKEIRGYIYNTLCHIEKPDQPKKPDEENSEGVACKVERSANVRSGPGTRYRRTTALAPGRDVKVVETIGRWGRIEFTRRWGLEKGFVYLPLLDCSNEEQ